MWIYPEKFSDVAPQITALNFNFIILMEFHLSSASSGNSFPGIDSWHLLELNKHDSTYLSTFSAKDIELLGTLTIYIIFERNYSILKILWKIGSGFFFNLVFDKIWNEFFSVFKVTAVFSLSSSWMFMPVLFAVRNLL